MSSTVLPTVSVVMPNYNHAEYLLRSLNAIVNQSVPPLELIVIDDCSTDNSISILAEFAQKYSFVRYYRNEKNQGVVKTINDGLDLAKGDYVYFPGADDEICPGFFEKSLQILAKHPQAALCCTIGDWYEVASGWNWQVSVGMSDQPTYFSPDEIVQMERSCKFYMASHTTIFKRSALQEAGKFIPELRWYTDWFATHATGLRHGICYVPEKLALFYIYPTSYFTTGRAGRLAHREVLENLLNYCLRPDYADILQPLRRSAALYEFGLPVLRIILSRRKYWCFLTPLFLFKSLWHSIKLTGKKFMPKFVAEWYFQLAGYKVKSQPGG
ncbi:MAG: glycosyltransferase family 2 protein [Limisphaerales bacterium]